MKQYIYKIIILSTNKYYIGITNNIKQRLSQHKHNAKMCELGRNNFYLDWSKYNINENFELEILEEFEFINIEHSLIKEESYINLYNSCNLGYNIAFRGSQVKESKLKGVKKPKAFCEKISKTHWDSSGIKNPFAKYYKILDSNNRVYICYCRSDIVKKLNISWKQMRLLIANKNCWYLPKHNNSNNISYKLIEHDFIKNKV